MGVVCKAEDIKLDRIGGAKRSEDDPLEPKDERDAQLKGLDGARTLNEMRLIPGREEGVLCVVDGGVRIDPPRSRIRNPNFVEGVQNIVTDRDIDV